MIPPKQKTAGIIVGFFAAATLFRYLAIWIFRYLDGGESGGKRSEFENDAEFEVVFHLVGEVETLFSPEVVDFFKFVSDEKA